MNCALWLNKRKIRSASEIPDNLDVASLRGYFLAGSLSEWLSENGGEHYAKKLTRLSPDDPALNEKLARIFGGKADFGKALNNPPPESVQSPMPSAMPGSFPGSFASSFLSSFTPRNSFRFSHFGSGGSFKYEWLTSFGGFFEFLSQMRSGSFAFLSGSFGSFQFHEWEWLFELYKRWSGGSFTFTTGSFGSFQYHKWEWEWLMRLWSGAGSFSITSFSSFAFPFGFGSFDIFEKFGGKTPGSFEIKRLLENLELDEYDRIMFETLMICPLNRFGYGIHNI